MINILISLSLLSGFDLIDVGKEEVLLVTGKNVSRRMITYALQGLLAVFGESLYSNLGCAH